MDTTDLDAALVLLREALTKARAQPGATVSEDDDTTPIVRWTREACHALLKDVDADGWGGCRLCCS